MSTQIINCRINIPIIIYPQILRFRGHESHLLGSEVAWRGLYGFVRGGGGGTNDEVWVKYSQ